VFSAGIIENHSGRSSRVPAGQRSSAVLLGPESLSAWEFSNAARATINTLWMKVARVIVFGDYLSGLDRLQAAEIGVSLCVVASRGGSTRAERPA
jgi:hypothetical protein